ncbi:glycosyltransferase family 2 protein [Absicoccus porci]|uniref:glycosyltransferase family 2 protein n=1 Tax=Absicoccus porci TaxID=2486576 RepID=UPI002943E695|nr:glycosyltransferase family 2 protein [Absicoccus porci]
MEELVSVIIPNYNKAPYLEQCIKSVESQTYTAFEIIVVDDCSTDESKEVLDRLIKEYNNIIVYKQNRNQGVSAARNKGVEIASGKFITMLDSDDYYVNPEKLENEMKIASSTGWLSYSKIVRVNERNERCDKQFLDDYLYLHGDILFDIMIGKNLNTIPRDFIIPKELFIQSGGYKKGMNLYEDLDFLIKILSKTKAECTYAEGTAYRQTGIGLSSKPAAKKYRIRWKLCWGERNRFDGTKKIHFMTSMIVSRLTQEAKFIIKRVIRYE